MNWALARGEGWDIVLRIEDLDSPRVKQGTDREAIDLLTWLGIDWDQGPVYQSSDPEPYRAAMRVLCARGLVYPSHQSRAEIEAAGDAAASAPQEGSHELAFPHSLRPPSISPRAFDDERMNWRLVVPDALIPVDERFANATAFNVSAIVGDFLVWTRRGVPAYQLAVVVDDARQGVTQIVRGDDLLDSAARQVLIASALGFAYTPVFFHLPLVRGTDGRRLAKRHGDTRLGTFRQGGVRPERVVGLVAAWTGILPRNAPEEMDAREFRDRLDPTRIPRESVVMTPEDAQWLQANARSR